MDQPLSAKNGNGTFKITFDEDEGSDNLKHHQVVDEPEYLQL